MDSQYPNVLRTGGRNTLRAEGSGAGIPPKPPTPRVGPVTNPNVAKGIASAEGLAQSERLTAQLSPGPEPLRGMPPAAARPAVPTAAAPAVSTAAPVTPAAPTAVPPATPGPAAPATLRQRAFGGLGRSAATVVKGARAMAPAAAAVGAINHFNDYKIDDPETDSSAAGTWKSLRNGDWAGAGRSMSKGALETLMDIGSAAASAADLVVPGDAPVSTKYDRFLQDQFGSQLLRGSGVGSASAPTPKPTALTAAAAPPAAAAPEAPPAPPRLAVDQRNDDWTNTEVAKRNPSGQVKVTMGEDGVPTFSGNNVSGAVSYADANGKPITGKGMEGKGWGGGVNVMPMPKGEGLRDGFGPGYSADGIPLNQGAGNIRGSTLGSDAAAAAGMTGPVGRMTALEMSRMPPQTRHELRVQAARDAGDMNRAQLQADTQRYGTDVGAASSRFNTSTNAETLRRGQDMDLEGRLLPKQWDLAMQQQQRARAAAYFRQAGGDYAQAAKLAAADGFGDLATSFQGSAGANSKYAEEQLAGVRGLFKNQFDTTGSDGKVVSRPDLEAAATEQVMKMTGGNFLSLPPEQRNALMSKAINDVKALGDANQLRGGGVLQAVGWDSKPPAYSQLPSAAEDAGSTLRQASMFERLDPLSPLKNGDWVQTTGDGREFRFRGDTLDQSQINERLRNGAKLK